MLVVFISSFEPRAIDSRVGFFLIANRFFSDTVSNDYALFSVSTICIYLISSNFPANSCRKKKDEQIATRTYLGLSVGVFFFT